MFLIPDTLCNINKDLSDSERTACFGNVKLAIQSGGSNRKRKQQTRKKM